MTENSDTTQQNYFSEDNATLGDRIAAARRATGLTQQQLAEKIGIKMKTLLNWEEDASEPRANKLQMLAGILNISIIWLLTGVGEDVRDPWREDQEIDGEKVEILAEIRSVQGEYRALGARLARLEKRLVQRLNS